MCGAHTLELRRVLPIYFLRLADGAVAQRWMVGVSVDTRSTDQRQLSTTRAPLALGRLSVTKIVSAEKLNFSLCVLAGKMRISSL